MTNLKRKMAVICASSALLSLPAFSHAQLYPLDNTDPQANQSATISTSAEKHTMSSKDSECGIWLCLPTGFPSGCSKSKKQLIKRIKKRKAPLPNILGCLAPGSASNGKPLPFYETGYERHHECREGYTAYDYRDDGDYYRRCTRRDSSCGFNEDFRYNNQTYFNREENGCVNNYMAAKRAKPRFVKATVPDAKYGDKVGTYWYR